MARARSTECRRKDRTRAVLIVCLIGHTAEALVILGLVLLLFNVGR